MTTKSEEVPKEISATSPLERHLRAIEQHLTKNDQYTKVYSLAHPLVDKTMAFPAIVGTARPGVAAVPASRNQPAIPAVPATEATAACLKQQSELLTYILKFVNLLPLNYLHRANTFDGGPNRLIRMAHDLNREGIRDMITEIRSRKLAFLLLYVYLGKLDNVIFNILLPFFSWLCL